MGRLTAIVLGSAGGGGYPQWNCLCASCRLAWSGDKRVKPRSQASLAVSADGENWTLINASPDLRAQLLATPQLRPRGGARGSPIAAVVLTGAEIDQIAGLLTLRERQPFALFATAQTHATLECQSDFRRAGGRCRDPQAWSRRRNLFVAGRARPPSCSPSPARCRSISKTAKIPARRRRPAQCRRGTRFGSRRLAYVPGAAAMTARLAATPRRRRRGVVRRHAVCRRRDDRAGIGEKTGRRMGHMPLDGEGGSLAALAGLAAAAS
jgi:pyrroloquinoline quinone biosynthesis protein B